MVSADQLASLAAQGFDLHGAHAVAGGTEVDLVLRRAQRAKLAGEGIRTTITRVRGGITVQQFAARQALDGFNVWRSYDEPGGFRDQMYEAARENPRIAKLVRIGRTLQGREILALKLTHNARWTKDGKRPAVLYSSTQHAREWIACEVNRRLMFHYIDGWRSGDRSIRRLLQKTRAVVRARREP